MIKYIFVNETGSANAAGVGHGSRVSDFRHHIVVNSKGCSRRAVIDQLTGLRRKYPDAKILGLGEIDGEHIRPSKAMNRLRRALSDLE